MAEVLLAVNPNNEPSQQEVAEEANAADAADGVADTDDTDDDTKADVDENGAEEGEVQQHRDGAVSPKEDAPNIRSRSDRNSAPTHQDSDEEEEVVGKEEQPDADEDEEEGEIGDKTAAAVGKVRHSV
jgi:hypothetical protein